MNRTNFLRLSYRLILRMHPDSFRDRFGDEMLWIFDEQVRDAKTSVLFTFADVLASLIRQYWQIGNSTEAKTAPFELQVATISIGPFQWLQATAGALMFVLAFSLAVAEGSPSSQNYSLRLTEKRFIPFTCNQTKTNEMRAKKEFSDPLRTIRYRPIK